MDIFEKQQAIEAIKTVIKARWFYVSALVAQGAILKLFFPSVPLPSNLQIPLVAAAVLFVNFIFWLYLRRAPERTNDFVIRMIRFFQIPLDQLGLAAVFYYSGTANKVLIIMYVTPIMVATILYKAKGVALATFSTMVIYSGLVILEYFGLMPYVPPEAAFQSAGKLLRGEWTLAKVHLVIFNCYIVTAAFYAAFLANLFKMREKRLVEQKNELRQKTEQLTLQTQELIRDKDQIHGALLTSDIARRAATQSRDEAEKANTELQKKIDELEKFYNVTIGREVRMVELKEKIKELEKKMKEKEKKEKN